MRLVAQTKIQTTASGTSDSVEQIQNEIDGLIVDYFQACSRIDELQRKMRRDFYTIMDLERKLAEKRKDK